MRNPWSRPLFHITQSLAAIGLFSSLACAAQAASYFQTDLVSDIPGFAVLTDASLINPWGVSHSPTSPFWVSDQGTSLATLYAVNGGTVTKAFLTVAIPTTASGPQGPTGQVFNSSLAFTVGTTAANFIFANLNGTISAWNNSAGTTAQVKATTVGAAYTGLAINAAQSRLYAANGAGTGGINVFASGFAPASLLGAFTDPTLPTGLVPFNVQDIGGKVYVTYAPAGRPAQIAATAGIGQRNRAIQNEATKKAIGRAISIGWRRSADRTSLQANSLVSGNFTGNSAILGLRDTI